MELTHGAALLEMPGERSYPVNWEQCDPLGPDRVNRVLDAVNTTTYQLDAPEHNSYIDYLKKGAKYAAQLKTGNLGGSKNYNNDIR